MSYYNSRSGGRGYGSAPRARRSNGNGSSRAQVGGITIVIPASALRPQTSGGGRRGGSSYGRSSRTSGGYGRRSRY